MAQSNLETIRGIYDAFAKGDIPAVLGTLDPQIEWHEAENFIYAAGNPYVGPQAVLEGIFMRLGSEWEGFSAAPEHLLDAGDHVVALGYYVATHKGTGKNVRAQYAHVWRLRDGRPTHFQQYTDTKQFADAVAV